MTIVDQDIVEVVYQSWHLFSQMDVNQKITSRKQFCFIFVQKSISIASFHLRFLEARASHGPGMSVTRSVTRSFGHTLADLYSEQPFLVLYSVIWSLMAPYGPEYRHVDF